jgi:hypothetical protein
MCYGSKVTIQPDDTERKARAKKRSTYPGEIVATHTQKPELYAQLNHNERFAAMSKLCESQWLVAHGKIDLKNRSEWPGESFRIERD